jgi:uridine kinase
MTPRFIAIAGGTASGKSTLTVALAQALGDRCAVLLHDSYYRPLPPQVADAGRDWNFDHPDALETERLVDDLRQLRAGRPVTPPAYDFATHTRWPAERWSMVPARPIVLVDGILVLAEPSLRDHMDARVFVDTPADVRLIRRIRRDTTERGRSVNEVLTQYERTVRPMHLQFVEPSKAHADLVLDGTRPIGDLVADARAALRLDAETGRPESGILTA